MTLRKLPIGIQSFQEMRTGGYAYVDKTPFIASLVREGKYYFLSRPRRFGKSLFIDTLDCAFSGRRDLFSGLFLNLAKSGWDFSHRYPVLRIDFAGGTLRSGSDLQSRLHRILDYWETSYSIEHTHGSPGDRLLSLIPRISEKTGSQVVILVDEYDKPILDNLLNPDVSTDMRELLKDFYGAIKPLDVHVKFVLLTGVSKFSKTGIFSGLNNLKDITLDSRYSAICGYTEKDLEEVFGEWLIRFQIQEVKEWYNGYSWTGQPVYNPFDILLLFDQGIYKAHWFETGTPTFLMNLWKKKPRLPAEYDGLIAGEELLGSFDIDTIRLETLLFQTGYLTIRSWVSNADEGTWYTLGFPNREVREAFNKQILLLFDSRDHVPLPVIRTTLESGDTEKLRTIIYSFFASIPHDWYRKNEITKYEEFYATVLYACFASLGYEIIPEDTSSKGRIDLTVKTKTGIWLFEFKIKGHDAPDGKTPLAQIRERKYADKYRSDTRKIYEIGIFFDPDTKNIETWEVGEPEFSNS